MWIKRSEYEAMQNRLKAAEKKANELDSIIESVQRAGVNGVCMGMKNTVVIGSEAFGVITGKIGNNMKKLADMETQRDMYKAKYYKLLEGMNEQSTETSRR